MGNIFLYLKFAAGTILFLYSKRYYRVLTKEEIAKNVSSTWIK
jgi:hypothetical protein